MSTYSAASFMKATGIHKNDVLLEIVGILNHYKQLHHKHSPPEHRGLDLNLKPERTS